MKATNKLRWIVGIAVVAFIFAFGSILIFGLMDTARGLTIPMFKTIYFTFAIAIFGIGYLASRNSFKTGMEHALVIVSILVFSASIATFAGNFKGAQDTSQYLASNGGVAEFDTQSIDPQYIQSMIDRANSLNETNNLIAQGIVDASKKLDNRTPVVIETVQTIPGEIIYVQDPPVMSNIVTNAPQPVQNIQYERESGGGGDD